MDLKATANFGGGDAEVTRQVEARQADLSRVLERAAFEWRATFDAIATPILLLGLDGRVRRVNRATRDLLNRDFREIIGRPVSELGAGQPWEAAAALVGRVMESYAVEVCEARDERGAKIWEVEASVSASSGDAEVWVIVQLRDVTETVRLQESLHRSETMAALGAVVGGVAHEVRNPLFGMTAVLDAFESRFGERPEYRPYLPLLRAELGRMTGLMQALLDYGKPARFEMSLGDPREPLESALGLCRSAAERARVELDVEPGPRGVQVLLDRERLAQAFKNIVENAVQHSEPGGRVTIRMARVTVDGAPWARASVHDRGPGFAPVDLPRALEPFYSRRKGGTGLGLSIVSRIVEGHGGRVRVSNHPQGGGLVEIDIPSLRSKEEL